MCLLEVVADDLECPVALLEPGGMALVEVGPELLRDSRIGDIANERVVEAVEVVPRSKRADQALAQQLRQAIVDPGELLRR